MYIATVHLCIHSARVFSFIFVRVFIVAYRVSIAHVLNPPSIQFVDPMRNRHLGIVDANNHTSVLYSHIWLYWLSNITTRQISHTSQSILLASLTCTHTHTHTHTHFDSTMWTPLTRIMWIDFFLTHLAHLSTIQIYHVIFQIIDCILILRLIRIKSVFPFGLLQPIAGRKGM